MLNTIKNITFLGGSQAIRLLAPLVLLPLLSTTITEKELTQYLYIQVLAGWLAILVDFGTTLAAVKYLSERSCGSNEINIIASFIFLRLVVLAIFSVPVWFLVDGREDFILVVLLGGVVGLFPIFVYQYWGMYKYYSSMDIIFTIFFLMLACLAYFYDSLNGMVALVLLSGLRVLQLLLLLLGIHKKCSFFDVGLGNVKRNMVIVFKESLPFAFFKVVSSFYTSASGAISTRFNIHGDELNLLSSERIYRPSLYFIGPVSDFFYPKLCKGEGYRTAAFFTLFFSGVTISLILYFFAKEILGFLFSGKVSQAEEILRVASCLPIVVALSNYFGVQTLLVWGESKIFNVCISIGGVLGLVLIAVFTYLNGALGAVWGVVMTELAVLMLMVFSVFSRRSAR